MPVWALYTFNILAFMSQENDYIESEEVLEEETTEVEAEDTEIEEIDWKERALKAEKAIIKSKTKKQNPVKKETVSNYQSQVDLLRFNGVSSDEIDKLKRIAELDGTDLIDARNSEDFTIWKERKEKEQAINLATTKTTNRGKVTTESIDKIKARVMAGTATKEDFAKLRKN